MSVRNASVSTWKVLTALFKAERSTGQEMGTVVSLALIECSNVPDNVDGMLMKILTIGVTGVDKCVKLVCKVNSLGVEFDLAGE